MESSGWRLEIAEGVATRESPGKGDRRPSAGRMEEEVVGAVTGDSPSAVVQLHVVEAAEQDASVDVGPSAL